MMWLNVPSAIGAQKCLVKDLTTMEARDWSTSNQICLTVCELLAEEAQSIDLMDEFRCTATKHEAVLMAQTQEVRRPIKNLFANFFMPAGWNESARTNKVGSSTVTT